MNTSTKEYPLRIERMAMRILIAIKVAVTEFEDEAIELNWPDEVSREVYCQIATVIDGRQDWIQ